MQFRIGSEYDEQFPEVLHRRCRGKFANSGEPVRTGFSIVAMNPDLDQFMRFECTLDFGEHAGRQPVVADHDDRLEGMGKRFELATVGW